MSESNPSPEFRTPFQVLVDHCEAAELRFRADPEAKGVFFSIRGELAIYDLALLITHEDEIFQVHVTLPVATREERLKPLVAEFVTRANHKLVLGRFDYDMDEGRLLFHVGHAFGDRGLDDQTIGRLLATAMFTSDRYFPALMRALVGGETPADAVYLAELDHHAESVEEPEGEAKAQEPPAKSEAPKPAKKSVRRSRKNPRAEKGGDLPDLFGQLKEEQGPEPKGSSPES